MADYYTTLEVKRTATSEEVAKAYRRLSLKYHPLRHKEDVAANTYKFTQIAEAYEVLSDPSKKAVFDQYGETVLKEGLPTKAGKTHCYRYAGNALQIFERFFGTENPFFEFADPTGVDLEGSMFGSAYGGAGHRPPQAPDDLTVSCECTLEELYMGCVKVLGYERTVLGLDGKSTKRVKETLSIEIKPGQSAQGPPVKFPGKGNEAYAYPTSDLIVKLVELGHARFQRKGDDLVLVHKTSLYGALSEAPFEIETLDHRKITVVVDEVINPKYKKAILGEGMPIFSADPLAGLRKEKAKGTLWVEFDIEFPKYLSEDKKQKLKDLLAQHEYR